MHIRKQPQSVLAGISRPFGRERLQPTADSKHLAQLRHETSESDFFQGLAMAKSLLFNAGVRER